MTITPASGKLLSHDLLDVLIRAGLIAVLVIACYWVFHPFLNLMLWSVILAVTLYPLHAKLEAQAGRQGGPYRDADRADLASPCSWCRSTCWRCRWPARSAMP